MPSKIHLILSTSLVLSLTLVLFFLSPSVPAPPSSPSSPSLSCITRSTIIIKGQNWVDRKVPYNNNGQYDGYPTDDSGFVSMAWGVGRPGFDDLNVTSLTTVIKKDQLQAGDALHCSGMYIALFVSWSGGDKNSYVGMENSNLANGTVKAVIPYPYYSNQACFKPLKYNQVCP